MSDGGEPVAGDVGGARPARRGAAWIRVRLERTFVLCGWVATAVLALAGVVALGSVFCEPGFVGIPRAPGAASAASAAPSTDDEADRLFVCLALSGGGTRAGALSLGALEALRDTEIEWPPESGRRVSLLDEVDVISAVSGGAFTAAAFGLGGHEVFESFRTDVLERDLTGEIARRIADPRTWFRLARGDYSRIDIAADLYAEELFGRATFGSMAQRPRVVISATNVSTGGRFAFTEASFDLIGADLSSFPVGYAVAASSAFPILLSPLTLAVHAVPEGYTFPADLERALEAGPLTPPRRRFELARDLAPYVRERESHRFVHLLDGGLADNLGLRHVIESWQRGDIRQRLNRGSIERLLVVVVNAKAAPTASHDGQRAPPGVVDVGYETATISMENYTFETVEVMADLFDARRRAQTDLAAANARIRLANERLVAAGLDPVPEFHELPREVGLDLVEVTLEQVPDPERRARLLAVPTRLTLPAATVGELIDAGRELVQSHPQMQSFLKSIE